MKTLKFLTIGTCIVLLAGKGVGQVNSNTTYGGVPEDGGGLGKYTSIPGGSGNTGFGTDVFGPYGSTNPPAGANANTAVGAQAMYDPGTGTLRNTTIGANSQYTLSGGVENSSLGYEALYTNATGTGLTALGAYALYSSASTSGTDNYSTAVGWSALYHNNGGSYNTAVGASALYTNSTGSYNTALGYQALMSNGSSYNTAVGYNALSAGSGIQYSTAVGYNALNAVSGATDNTALGYEALEANSTGTFNTALGDQTLIKQTTADHNIAIGYQVLLADQTAGYNNIIGDGSFPLDYDGTGTGTEGARNVSLGYNCGLANTTGYQNTFVGCQTGNTNTTGYDNTCIGNAANIPVATYTDCTAIGNGAGNYIFGNDQIQLGNINLTYILAGASILWPSDMRIKDSVKENVPGLSFINLLKPVTYNLNLDKEKELLGVKDNTPHGKYDAEKIKHSGFLAQDVEAAAKKVGYDFSGVVHGKIYGLCYSDFVMPLVKSVQELSAQNNQLKSSMDSLKNVVQNMQTCLNQICGKVSNPAIPAGSISSTQDVSLANANAPVLYQNIPNPFSSSTKINYFLPEGTQGASIVFYDNYGNQMKSIQLTQTGNGTLNLTPDNLASGVYSYSLVVNGTVVDTKRMILQK